MDRTKDVPEDLDETYEIGVRDGYEKAVQDIDLATGGDGEFYGSTCGQGVDVPVMKARIIERSKREATRPLTTEIADLRTQLDEAMEALGSVVNSCTLRSLRGHDHVPSMREQQDALSAARAILAKRKQP